MMDAHPFQEGKPGVSYRCVEEEANDSKAHCSNQAVRLSIEYLSYTVANHETNRGRAAFGQ